MACEENALAKALFKAVHAGIVVIDAETKEIIDINPAASFMIGVRREDVVGKMCSEYLCVEDCDGCPVWNRMTNNLSEGIEEVENREITIRRKDGSRVFALLTINSVLLNTEREERRLFINSLIDITKQKEAEEKAHSYWVEAEKLLADNVLKLKNGVV